MKYTPAPCLLQVMFYQDHEDQMVKKELLDYQEIEEFLGSLVILGQRAKRVQEGLRVHQELPAHRAFLDPRA